MKSLVILSVISFSALGLASCSISNPLSKNPEEHTVSGIDTGGVQISASGVSVSSENGNVSIGADGNVSVGSAGVNVSSGNSRVSVGKDGVKVGTGIRIPVQETQTGTKDPEVEQITKEIDDLFSDIEKGGK